MSDRPFARAIALLQEEADRLAREVRDLPVTPQVALPSLRATIEASYPLDRARPLDEVVRTTIELLRVHSLHAIHPRYFGLFNPSVHPSAVIADALVALFNPQVAGWSHAPAANEMERVVLQRVGTALGFRADDLAAHFTSGGNEANHTAVVACLAARYPAWRSAGLRGLARSPMLYVSSEAHHSFLKVARATGLGADALRLVPVDDALRMRPDALAEMIEQDRAAGHDPAMVVATAGTTGAGVIDPLSATGAIAAANGAWFHVDAAWGGAAVFSPRLRPALDGIATADSVTLDAHKWLSVPLGAGIFLTRHPAVLPRAFGVETGYVPPTETGAVDLYKTSMQWSRRFMGLKLLFLFAELGPDGVAGLLEHQAAMASKLREGLQGAGWRLLNDTVLPLVCFTADGVPSDEAELRAMVDAILARGRVWISTVKLPGHGWALRACITSWQTTDDDLRVLLEELELGRGRSVIS